jgi:hypothetical protein
MSLYAYHKLSNTAVPAYKLETDPIWMNKVNDEWLLPDAEIDNLLEVKKENLEPLCSFIKSHVRNDENVQCHFRSTNERVITFNEANESEEHMLAKHGIYYAILNNSLTFNIGGKSLAVKELPSFNMYIEKNIGIKRADVVLVFNKEDDILGKGIVIEIQLSLQNDYKTNIRSYDRALQGYSVVWLWDNNFQLNELINTELRVTPFRKVLEEYSNLIQCEEAERIAKYSLNVENKIKELNILRQTMESEKIFHLQNHHQILSNFSESFKAKLQLELEPIKLNLKEGIKNELNFYSKEVLVKANENKQNALSIIASQEENIKKEYAEAIDRIKKVSYDSLNSFNEQNQKKIEEILSKKINEGIELITPTLVKKINEKVNEEEYTKKINDVIYERTKELIEQKLDNIIDTKVNNVYESLLKEKSELLDRSILFNIKSLIGEKINKQVELLWKEQSDKVSKETQLLVPELKKMSFEYLKNRVNEVTNGKGS